MLIQPEFVLDGLEQGAGHTVGALFRVLAQVDGNETVQHAAAHIGTAYALGTREDDQLFLGDAVGIVIAVHQLVDVMLHEEGVVDEPRRRDDLVHIAYALEYLLAFFKTEFGLVALFALHFFVRGEGHDNGAEFLGFFQKANVTVMDERGRHIDTDAHGGLLISMGGLMGRAEGSEYGDEAAESGNRDEHDVPAARIEQEAVKQGLHGRAHVGAEVQAARRRAGEEAAAYVGGEGPCRAVDGVDAEARHEEQYLDEHELPHHSGVEQEEHVHGHGTDGRIVGAGPEAVVQVQLVAEPRHYQRTYAHTHGKRERGEQAVGNFDTELVDEIQRYPRHKTVAGKAYGEGHYHPQIEKPVGKHVLIGVELALGAQYFLHGRFVLCHFFRVFRVFGQAHRAGRGLSKDHVDDEHDERYGRRYDEGRAPAHFRQYGKGQCHGQCGRHLSEAGEGVGKAGGEAA